MVHAQLVKDQAVVFFLFGQQICEAFLAPGFLLLQRLEDVAVRVGRRSLHIARQSVVAGFGLSVGAMGVAALGYLPPVWGALFQEVIDVAVILNALRALRG